MVRDTFSWSSNLRVSSGCFLCDGAKDVDVSVWSCTSQWTGSSVLISHCPFFVTGLVGIRPSVGDLESDRFGGRIYLRRGPEPIRLDRTITGTTV